MPPVEPVYGLTEGLYPRMVQKAAEAGLARLPKLPEWIDAPTLSRLRRPASPRRSRAMHEPQRARRHRADEPRRRAGSPSTNSRQPARAVSDARAHARAARPRDARRGRIAETLLASLPYGLTGAQARAIEEIRADLAAPATHDPAAARRRRLGQDDRRADRDGPCRRGRTAGRADGAHAKSSRVSISSG